MIWNTRQFLLLESTILELVYDSEDLEFWRNTGMDLAVGWREGLKPPTTADPMEPLEPLQELFSIDLRRREGEV